MDKVTVSPVVSRFLAENILLNVGTVIGNLAYHIHLFTAGPTPITPFSVVGDFTECTFAGYAPVVVTYASNPPTVNFPNSNGQGALIGANFVAGAIVGAGETALGFYVTDDTDTNMVYSETFDDGVPFAIAGDFLDLETILPIWEIGNVR